MAENSSQPLKLPETLDKGNKKVRRGQRRKNKPKHVVSVEKVLATAMGKLELQHKERQPKKQRIPAQEAEKINKNDSRKRTEKINITVASIFTQSRLEDLKIKPEQDVPSSSQKLKKKQKNNKKVKKEESKNKPEKPSIDSSVNFVACNVNGNGNQVLQTSIQSQKKDKNEKNKFDQYISERIVRKLLSIQDGKECPEYVKGNIRINPKFFKEAYISMPNNEIDIFIDGMQDRNRALEGDLVVVRINPEEKWRELKSARLQKTGKVVCILEKIHPRKIVGFLKPMPDRNKHVALFCPKDHKVPRLNINSEYWPANFLDNPGSFARTMFFAEITSWNDIRYAHGKILMRIGDAGDLKAESRAILMDNHLDVTPYVEKLTLNIPPSDYQPTMQDIEGREDWRKECIFTIDPATAQDLDDAMSCKPLENGNFEVGVHISDVTHYLAANSALDKAVSKRATTVYMSDAVYHMLPKQLCNVCSLLPGSDKLAFSIIFEITSSGEVVKHRFVKSVINSCCQLSYEHAQIMIENSEEIWPENEIPKITNSYKISQLSIVVNNLNNLAVKMRENRFNSGSLTIDQPKLHVFVDRASGLPVSFTLEEHKDSNRLIEEFMLLANMTVASYLYENLPDVALLRRHHEPLIFVLTETQAMLEKLGIHIDIESAGALHASLLRYQPHPDSDSKEAVYLANCRSRVLNALCSKTMIRAEYFCTSAEMTDELLRHYALNVPYYTHFTSPIRRYPDCIVHRLLHASIQGALPIPKWTPGRCASIAKNCNRQKYNAKRAQEMSSELYLTAFLGHVGPIVSTAIVIDVKDRSFNAIICNMGINLRIYSADIEKSATVTHDRKDDIQTLTIVWQKSNTTQVINIFSILGIRVSKHPETNRLHGELLEPERERINI